MVTAISWLGFLGVWLLFAGAIYQAVLELRAHQLADDRIQAAGAGIAAPSQISAWWWLVPPVKFFLERRRAIAYRQAFFEAMTVEDFAALVAFFNKATGWLLVALGGIMLAAKETYQFCQDRRVGLTVFFFLLLGMIALCVLSCFIRLGTGERWVAKKKGIAAEKHQA